VTRTRDLLITNHRKPLPPTSVDVQGPDFIGCLIRGGVQGSTGVHSLGCQIGCQSVAALSKLRMRSSASALAGLTG